MSSRIACVVLAIVLAMLAGAAEAAAQWRQLRSANFLFVGNASDGDIRRLAETLEQFHAALAELPGFDRRVSVPTVVLVFNSSRSFAPYRPRFEGRPVEASGVFVGDDDINYIAIDAGSETRAVRAVLHEYAHFLVERAYGQVPLWVAEGMAQVYESFRLLDDRSAAIGAPLVDHVALLRGAALMPLAELTTIDIASAVYHEGNRRGLFYAQSWALMHYLMLGHPDRAGQMREFLALTGGGTDPAEAFGEAFGAPAAIERELGDYVRQRAFRGLRVDMPPELAAAVPRRGDRMMDADAEAYLVDLLVRQRRGAEARPRLERLLASTPDHPRASVAFAELDLHEGRSEEAILRLQAAAAAHPDNGVVLAALGRAWLEHLPNERNMASRRGTLQEARAMLARAEALDPDVLHTRALLGFAEATIGDLARGIELLDDAVARAPGRGQYRLMLADALIRANNDEAAAAHLERLLDRGSDAAVREQAEERLEGIALRRRLREGLADATKN